MTSNSKANKVKEMMSAQVVEQIPILAGKTRQQIIIQLMFILKARQLTESDKLYS